MDRHTTCDLLSRNRAAVSLPPPMIGETGWDVLLALYSEERSGLTLEKLAAAASVPRMVLGQWLDWLEERELTVSGRSRLTNQFEARITRTGSALVQDYLAATSRLQGAARS